MQKILLVEDDNFLREFYKEILDNQGYEVHTACDGLEALEKIKNGGWDLVLLDVFLPKLNGTQIIKELKKTPPVRPNKSIVFLTNLDNCQEIEKGSIGYNYLIKSQLEPDEFLEKVKFYLKN